MGSMPYRMYDVARPYPGEGMQVNMALTIDHGGQAWMVVACNEIRPEEMTIGCCWSDPMHNRKKHFMPSSPSAFCLRLGTERVFRHSCRAMCRNETPKMRKSQYELATTSSKFSPARVAMLSVAGCGRREVRAMTPNTSRAKPQGGARV